MRWIANALGPKGYGCYEVVVEADRVRYSRVSETSRLLFAPGFVDIHLHGAFGIDFMSASPADMIGLCDLLAAEGYEGFLPTTVTAAPEAVKAAVSGLPDHPMILGFHLEGPFISDKHPGAQPAEHIASLADLWDFVWDSRLKVITLAPELEGALDVCSELSSLGVIVSFGHSDATYDQALEAFGNVSQGHVTHTFNAMRPFHHREPGLVGFALLTDAVYAELIYDRLHVSPAAAALLVRSKPSDKLIAVSDSTMASRMPSGARLSMWGQDCITALGEVRLASNQALAGSAITLLDAFRNLAEDFGDETAIRATSLNPRQALNMHQPPSKYVLLDADYQILETVSVG